MPASLEHWQVMWERSQIVHQPVCNLPVLEHSLCDVTDLYQCEIRTNKCQVNSQVVSVCLSKARRAFPVIKFTLLICFAMNVRKMNFE